MTGTPTQTDPAKAYAARQQNINSLMRSIEKALQEHGVQAQANPADWGFVGDLGATTEHLIEALASLTGAEPEQIHQVLAA